MPTTYHGGDTNLPNSNPNAKNWTATSQFDDSTTSDPVNLIGSLSGLTVSGLSTGSDTLALQVYDPVAAAYGNTDITISIDTAITVVKSSVLADISGFLGRSLRFSSTGNITTTLTLTMVKI